MLENGDAESAVTGERVRVENEDIVVVGMQHTYFAVVLTLDPERRVLGHLHSIVGCHSTLGSRLGKKFEETCLESREMRKELQITSLFPVQYNSCWPSKVAAVRANGDCGSKML